MLRGNVLNADDLERHPSNEESHGNITGFLARLPGRFAGVLVIVVCWQQSTNVRADESTAALLASGHAPTFSWDFGARWEDVDTPDLFSNVIFPGMPGQLEPADTAGLRTSLSFRLPLQDTGIGPFFLEWDAAISRAGGSSGRVVQPTGSGFDLAAGEPAGGIISLATVGDIGGATAAGTIHFKDSSRDPARIMAFAHSPAGDNAITQYATSGTQTGAAFLALVTRGNTPSAAAYAAFADDRGLFFQALGDLDGTVVRSTIEQRARHFDQTLWLGAALELGNGWTVTPRLGPTYRSTRQDTTFRTEVDIAESIMSGASIPAIGYQERVNVSADYYGVLAGFSAETPVTENLLLRINVSGGAAHYRARLDNRATAIFPESDITFSSSEQGRRGGTFLADASAVIILSSRESFSLKFEAGTSFLADTPIYRSGKLGTESTQSYYLAVGLEHRF